MKKITLLLILLTVSFGYSQSPTDNAPTPPVRNASDVISIYGDAYTNISNINYDPNWGQSGFGQVNTAFDPGTGNVVLAYPNFNYQGTDFGTNNQNAAGMEYLHVDLWTSANPANTILQVSPINSGTGTGETLVTINYTSGTWVSVDIPKSSFTGQTWDNVIQLKFAGNGAGSTVPVDIYLDNIYFWKPETAPGSDATLSDLKVDGVIISGFDPSVLNYVQDLQIGTTTVPQITSVTTTDPNATSAVITQAPSIPNDATVVVTSQNGLVTETYTVSFTATLPNTPPIPSTPNSEVLSIYGDTGGFTNIWASDYDFGAVDGRPDLDPTANVNEVIKMDFSKQGYGEGTDNQTNVTAYNYLHFDYFAEADATEIRMILIGSGIGEFFYELTPGGATDGTLVTGTWVSVNVPLSDYVAKGWDKTNFLQFKLGTTSDLVSKIVYFDNIYFSVNPGTLGTKNVDLVNLNTYPNPVVDELQINSENIIEKAVIYNVLGKVVKNISINKRSTSIDVSNLSTGIYILKYAANNTFGTKKFIKR